MSEKVKENYLRRQADRLGLSIRKSSGKKWSVNNQMGWMIVDAQRNIILQGDHYNLNLEEVETFLNEFEKTLKH